MLCYKCEAFKRGMCCLDGRIKSRCGRTERKVLEELNALKLKRDLDNIAQKYYITDDKNKKELLKYEWYQRLRRG